MPSLRIRDANDAPLRPRRDYVLYWMTAARRPGWNFALDRAVARARELGRPLVIFEALRAGYRWAADRHHRFVLQGMEANRAAIRGATYVPYVEPRPGDERGLLQHLAARACLVVGDDSPAFFLPRMTAAAASRLDVRLELVDSIGLLPLSAAEAAYPTAHSFRRFLQRRLPAFLDEAPSADPLRRAGLPMLRKLPSLRRWPSATELSAIPIDHSVAPVPMEGGFRAGRAVLKGFLGRLDRYPEDRNNPSVAGSSGLSPWLHFGHVSAHEIFAALAKREDWDPGRLGRRVDGRKEGWWGLSPAAEAYLDELVTWRELAHVTASRVDDHDRYEALPPWARRTLEEHAGDRRSPEYSIEELDRAATHDPLWNAAQRQLRTEGRIHNYLRMLWGKKVLEWSVTPRAAFDALVELNNRYAVDGRDPNSYAGISWCLGKYDRPWGPVRAIFGTVRYMSSANTARKLDVKGYLSRWGA